MAYLKIYCTNCGRSWDIHESRNFNDEKARICPHCESSIEQGTWEKFILPALGTAADANRELLKDHTGQNARLFYFDIIADHAPTPEADTQAKISAIGAELKRLRDSLTKLSENIEIANLIHLLSEERGHNE